MNTEGHGASRGSGDGIHNEDAFLVDEGLGLYVVCDGASETAAGEVAATIAADAVAASIERSERDLSLQNRRLAQFMVGKAMKHAMRAIAKAEKTDPELLGLSTTVTLLLVYRNLGVIGHRGDSRAYLIRRERAHQLTVDHELAERFSDGESVPSTTLDIFALEFRPGDTIILCTDGAERVVDDPAMVRIASSLSPRLLASRIVSAAGRRDPNVDATAVVVRVRGESERGWLELSQLPRGTAFGHTLEHA